jgi:hypothetical protein
MNFIFTDTWVDIPDYEGYYQINPDGRVRSVDRVVMSKGGTTRRIRGKQLQPSFNNMGYPQYQLSKNHKSKNFSLHRLLAIVFIPNPDNLPIVRHLNDNIMDYRLENLAWGTRRDNSLDMYANGHGRRADHLTYCIHGHELSEENTYIAPKTGYRQCLTCKRQAWRRFYAKSLDK